MVALLLVELLIRVDVINRFIVPMPSDIIAAFPRVIVEEDVLDRFLLTAGEAFSACILVTLFGVAGGVLLYRYHVLRLATETWVAAVAAAPLVLMYPLYLVIFGRSALTIVMMGFTAGLAPIILKTLEGLSGTRPRADQCRQELQPHAARSSSGRSCFRRRCRRSSSACGSG